MPRLHERHAALSDIARRGNADRLKVDHQVYPNGEGIRNCRSAFRMDEVLKTGLNDQPWSDRASICPLNGGFEISHRYGPGRGIARLFGLLETRGIQAVS